MRQEAGTNKKSHSSQIIISLKKLAKKNKREIREGKMQMEVIIAHFLLIYKQA